MNLMELTKKTPEIPGLLEYLTEVNERFLRFPEDEQKEISAIAEARFCGLDMAMMIFETMGITGK